jgi:hypothetical protein
MLHYWHWHNDVLNYPLQNFSLSQAQIEIVVLQRMVFVFIDSERGGTTGTHPMYKPDQRQYH